ncbi:hypothetical protein J1N35_002188 [Gossypium stocksii]|uniref:HMA domain-containing protein n=1 Tax=Gossypium stocksii TaxID=47602 RepID=A0A9D3WK37_9ROSI|nr:hypothetical protein J1N35_002188 [Gossypium stocksii]
MHLFCASPASIATCSRLDHRSMVRHGHRPIDPQNSDHVSAKPKHVVVLRVSIHCKGCEGKVRKQISKMEGVTSFSIDLATKNVTVIGDVTPSSVLASVSKVKNAQLWSYPSASPSVVKPITD